MSTEIKIWESRPGDHDATSVKVEGSRQGKSILVVSQSKRHHDSALMFLETVEDYEETLLDLFKNIEWIGDFAFMVKPIVLKPTTQDPRKKLEETINAMTRGQMIDYIKQGQTGLNVKSHETDIAYFDPKVFGVEYVDYPTFRVFTGKKLITLQCSNFLVHGSLRTYADPRTMTTDEFGNTVLLQNLEILKSQMTKNKDSFKYIKNLMVYTFNLTKRTRCVSFAICGVMQSQYDKTIETTPDDRFW